ncbi:MAG: TetR/AcrR family transcriptional regulator [Methanobacterium sp. ERen5]|nr:MAG: TetR/AcrR family transcriptional regulator [Methanobacterium sp. ERen5]
MSITNWRAREKQQRKDDILDAAEKLFFSKGYDNISMNDIAKEVGLNRATIYLYFDNKEELCLAIVLRGVQILNKLIKNQVKTATHSKKYMHLDLPIQCFFSHIPNMFKFTIYFNQEDLIHQV